VSLETTSFVRTSFRTASAAKLLLVRVGALPFFLIAALVVFTLASRQFLTAQNIVNVARQSVYLVLVSLGQMIVLLTGGFDLAVAATALHWVDPATSTEKIGHLVRPGGWLAAWWTEFGDAKRPTLFRDRLDDVYRDLLPAEGGYKQSKSHVLDTDRWRGQLTTGGYFDDVAVEIIEWEQRLTPQSARDQWSTFPNIVELAPEQRAEFLTRLGAIIDDLGGHVDDPRLTVVYTARRTRHSRSSIA